MYIACCMCVYVYTCVSECNSLRLFGATHPLRLRSRRPPFFALRHWHHSCSVRWFCISWGPFFGLAPWRKYWNWWVWNKLLELIAGFHHDTDSYGLMFDVRVLAKWAPLLQAISAKDSCWLEHKGLHANNHPASTRCKKGEDWPPIDVVARPPSASGMVQRLTRAWRPWCFMPYRGFHKWGYPKMEGL